MKVIIRPVISEKAVRLMESDNTLSMIVNMKANKQQIKNAIEETLKVKVAKIRTMLTTKNEKKALVKLNPESVALDVGTELGMI